MNLPISNNCYIGNSSSSYLHNVVPDPLYKSVRLFHQLSYKCVVTNAPALSLSMDRTTGRVVTTLVGAATPPVVGTATFVLGMSMAHYTPEWFY